MSSGKKAGLLMNEDFDPKTIKILRSVDIRRSHVYRMKKNKVENGGPSFKRNTHVATLWSNDHI